MPRRGRPRARRLGPSLLCAAVLAAGGAALATGCGSSDDEALTVSAASSLKTALTNHAEGFDQAEVRLAFGGSDQLAAQIRAGVRPDVYAAANTELPERLHAEGLVERPVRFASNRIVVAVRDDSDARTIGDIRRVAIGSPSVPVGAYARQALRRLGPIEIASEEPDVASIVARVRAGAVDAGFVYATDVAAVEGLRAIELPFRTRVEYAAAVVRGAGGAAREFVASLRGAEALRDAGFGP